MLLIIDWNKAIIAFTLNELKDVLLCVSIILNIVNIYIYSLRSERIVKLEKDYTKLDEGVKKVQENSQTNRQGISKLFHKVEPNTDKIERLQGQMDQVFELLGAVMGASDLIAGGLESPADRVEEARERIKWERERRRLNKSKESDFYEG